MDATSRPTAKLILLTVTRHEACRFCGRTVQRCTRRVEAEVCQRRAALSAAEPAKGG